MYVQALDKMRIHNTTVCSDHQWDRINMSMAYAMIDAAPYACLAPHCIP